jgi:hypothetical protein
MNNPIDAPVAQSKSAFAPSVTSVAQVGDECISARQTNGEAAALLSLTNLAVDSTQVATQTRRTILAPWYFELLSFRFVNALRTASCMPIIFVLKLSKHGHAWVLGSDIWREIDPSREFLVQCVLKYVAILGCLEVERRSSPTGNGHYFFRLKDDVPLVDYDGINGKLMEQILSLLTSINHARPKQTPRIGLLLFAVFARKLVKRTDIDGYMENQNQNASVIHRQIEFLSEIKIIKQLKEFRGYKSVHYVHPISKQGA